MRAIRIGTGQGVGVIDVVFAVAYAALLVAILVILRSTATAAILVAAGVGVSGVILQFAGVSGLRVTLPLLQWWLLVTLAVILVAAVVQRRHAPQRARRTALLLVLVPSAALALMLIVSRLLAPGAPGPLTAVGYLISRSSAEDNAKWLNAAAALASGAPVDAWANVGGPLLLLLTLAATLLASVSELLYGAVNEVAVSAGTPILSEMLLIVLAPFALAPLAEARVRRSTGGRPSPIPWPLVLLGIAVVTTAVTLLPYFGHLTLQYTIIVLTLWVSAFLTWRRARGALLLTTVAVVTTAEVWFPLNALALLILCGMIGLGIAAIVRRRRPRLAGAVVATGAVLLVLMWDFLQSSILYSLGLDGAASASASGSGSVRGIAALGVPSLPLFSEPGGTEIVSALMGAIAVISVIGSLFLLRDVGGPRYALRFVPIALLVTYAMLVTLADFWAVGTGPGYAANKLTFAVVIPALSATLPLALLALDRSERRMTVLRWFALGGVVMLLVLDTFLPRAVLQFKPALWPSTSGDPQPYWWPAEVRPTGTQSLAGNPIGCIYLPQGAERPSVLPDGQRAYSCTRLLTGVAGQDGPAAGVVRWTLDEWLSNESQWDHYQQYFAQMTPEARARTLILLDEDARVVGIESLQALMNRYPAEDAASTP